MNRTTNTGKSIVGKLIEKKETQKDVVEQEIIVSEFKPVIKSINSYCIIIYENIFYPVVIFELIDDTASIKSIKK